MAALQAKKISITNLCSALYVLKSFTYSLNDLDFLGQWRIKFFKGLH